MMASLIGAAAASLRAEEPPIQVNPNRPTFATPASTTQVGVAELELGLEQTLLREAGGVFFSPFLLKLGLTKRIELRLGGGGLLHDRQSGVLAATGFGDVKLSGQWCYLRDGPLGIDQAVQVTWKIPAASAPKGLGTGDSDGTLMALLSRDLGPFHADANLLLTWLGRPLAAGGGMEFQPSATLSVSRTLATQWSLTGEVYWIGASFENARSSPTSGPPATRSLPASYSTLGSTSG